MRFHPSSSSLLASGSLDYEVRLWNAHTAECINVHNFGMRLHSCSTNTLYQQHVLAVREHVPLPWFEVLYLVQALALHAILLSHDLFIVALPSRCCCCPNMCNVITAPQRCLCALHLFSPLIVVVICCMFACCLQLGRLLWTCITSANLADCRPLQPQLYVFMRKPCFGTCFLCLAKAYRKDMHDSHPCAVQAAPLPLWRFTSKAMPWQWHLATSCTCGSTPSSIRERREPPL